MGGRGWARSGLYVRSGRGISVRACAAVPAGLQLAELLRPVVAVCVVTRFPRDRVPVKGEHSDLKC